MPAFVLILFKFTAKDLLVDTNSSINTVIMNFLSIDCSTEIGSLFIKFENKTFSKVLQSDKFINDLMVEYILDFIKKSHLKLEDLDQIFINQGPGSFSRLRSSLAIAKGISFAKKINFHQAHIYISYPDNLIIYTNIAYKLIMHDYVKKIINFE